MGYPNLEHIIIDDGSTDGTPSLIAGYIELCKAQSNSTLSVKYIKQCNKGLGGATNTGLKAITGDYWTWINADDWYEPLAINLCIEYLSKRPQCDCVLMNRFHVALENGEKVPLISGTLLGTHASQFQVRKALYDWKMYFLHFLVKTASFKAINPEMAIHDYRYTQDIQLYVPIISNLSFGFISQPLVDFLVRKDSLAQKLGNKAELFLAVKRTYRFLSIPDEDSRSQLALLFLAYYYDIQKMDDLYSLNRKREYRRIYKTAGIIRSKISTKYKKYINKRYFWRYFTSFLGFWSVRYRMVLWKKSIRKK